MDCKQFSDFSEDLRWRGYRFSSHASTDSLRQKGLGKLQNPGKTNFQNPNRLSAKVERDRGQKRVLEEQNRPTLPKREFSKVQKPHIDPDGR